MRVQDHGQRQWTQPQESMLAFMLLQGMSNLEMGAVLKRSKHEIGARLSFIGLVSHETGVDYSLARYEAGMEEDDA